MRAAFSVLILGAGAGLLSAQTMIEYGVGAGRSGAAATAAPMGKAAAGAFGKVAQSLSEAGKTGNDLKPASKNISPVTTSAVAATPAAPAISTSPVVTVTATAAPKEEPLKPADLTKLETGMDRDDMLKKVGKPSMSLSSLESSIMVETCWYKSGSDSVTVILRDGKVASISGMPAGPAEKP